MIQVTMGRNIINECNGLSEKQETQVRRQPGCSSKQGCSKGQRCYAQPYQVVCQGSSLLQAVEDFVFCRHRLQTSYVLVHALNGEHREIDNRNNSNQLAEMPFPRRGGGARRQVVLRHLPRSQMRDYWQILRMSSAIEPANFREPLRVKCPWSRKSSRSHFSAKGVPR